MKKQIYLLSAFLPFLALVTVVLLFGTVKPASACSIALDPYPDGTYPTLPFQYSNEYKLTVFDVAIRGTFTGFDMPESHNNDPNNPNWFESVTAYKGNVEASIENDILTMVGFGNDGTCGVTLQVGAEYIIFADYNEDGNLVYKGGIANEYLSPVSDEDEILALVETLPLRFTNCDGKWNLADIVRMKRFDALLTTEIENCDAMNYEDRKDMTVVTCDHNGDGVCGVADALIIQQCGVFIDNGYCASLEA